MRRLARFALLGALAASGCAPDAGGSGAFGGHEAVDVDRDANVDHGDVDDTGAGDAGDSDAFVEVSAQVQDVASVDSADAEPELPSVEPGDALPARPSENRCSLPLSAETGLPPSSLRATECFVAAADGVPPEPGTELIPYEVNAQLWSDGAWKERFFVLPPGGRVTATGDAPWEFPVGAIIIKTFGFEFEGVELDDQTTALARRPVETRFMVLRDEGWTMHTYAWDEDGMDARLLSERVVVDLTVGAERRPLRYTFPSREQCGYCHSERTAMVLGPRTGQLERMVRYPAGQAEQLDVFQAMGVFADDARPSVPNPFADPSDERAPLPLRARSYLATNCAHCHQPGGWQPPPLTMDLRFDRTLEETTTCDVPLQYFSQHVPGSMRIAPGDLEESNLYQRLIRVGFGRMPPLAAPEVDEEGVALVAEWILSMDACD